MSYIGNHRVSEYYYTAHVQSIHRTYVSLYRARHPDTGQPLSWNNRLFGQIHEFNFMYSFKEHTAGVYYNVLGHDCRCRSIECQAMRPRAGHPRAEIQKAFRRLMNEFNSNPENEDFEIVAAPRFITRPRTGEEVVVFLLGILDSQRDVDNVLEMYSYPMEGWMNKFDRVVHIRDNLPQIRREINHRQHLVDLYRNGRAP